MEERLERGRKLVIYHHHPFSCCLVYHPEPPYPYSPSLASYPSCNTPPVACYSWLPRHPICIFFQPPCSVVGSCYVLRQFSKHLSVHLSPFHSPSSPCRHVLLIPSSLVSCISPMVLFLVIMCEGSQDGELTYVDSKFNSRLVACFITLIVWRVYILLASWRSTHYYHYFFLLISC